MKIKCDKCGKTLKKQGGLVFAPPVKFPIDIDGSFVMVSVKKHVCCDCMQYVMTWICGNTKTLPS